MYDTVWNDNTNIRLKKGMTMEKTKILVVDDESRMRKLVKDFLVRSNFEVLEAEDGAQALEM